MASDLALRIFYAHKELDEPMPEFSDDDVINYMVKEAIALRVVQERKAQEDKAKREAFKKGAVGSTDWQAVR